MPGPLAAEATPVEAALETQALTRAFDGRKVVDGLDLRVEEGEIFGFLGPNGAGKSTAIRMLCTLLAPTSGTAVVAGHDVRRDPAGVRRSIGLVSEKMVLYPLLTARENLRLFGRLYGVPRRDLEPRIDELLEVVQMTQWADARVGRFSTGMKQRVNIVRALVSRPRVLFLDEPTLGLDPQSTREVREFIRRINREHRTTVVLTTHIMVDADLLCDRVGVIDHGKIVALDTPRALKARLSGRDGRVLEVDLLSGAADVAREAIAHGLAKGADVGDGRVRLLAAGDLDALLDVVRRHGRGVLNLRSSEPTLEDVFLDLTGRALRDEPKKTGASIPFWLKPLLKHRLRAAAKAARKANAAKAEPGSAAAAVGGEKGP